MTADDSRSIASLYLAEANRMQAFARRRVGDADEAEDLVNEAFRVITERGTLADIRNPAAFLMTILDRQINQHLRQRYRRKQMSFEETGEEHQPSSPDVAEGYEERESLVLVKASLDSLRCERQRRILKLFSLNYKAGEIAQIETAAGKPTTSHQVSCVLQGALGNLRTQFRRKGLAPSILPVPWLLRMRLRISTRVHSLLEPIKLIDPGVAFQVALLVSVATIFSGASPGRVTAEPPPKSPSQPPWQKPAPPHSLSALLASWATTSTGTGDLLYNDREPGPGSGTALAAPTASASPPATAQPLSEVSSAADIPVEPQPRAEVSPDPETPRAHFAVDPSERSNIIIEETNSETPPDPLADQAVDQVEDPDRIPKPECGGLPICSEPEEGASSPPPEEGGDQNSDTEHNLTI